jgi:maltose O-acetyltransferase
VWVGGNVTILAGITIGNGCVVGAGSVVTRDVEDYSVVVGNPARVIKKVTPPENEEEK